MPTAIPAIDGSSTSDLATESSAPAGGDAPQRVRQPRARCADGAGTLSHLFFSYDDLDIARAKAMCARCELRTACLDGAMTRREAYGVWGGTLLLDGEPVRFAPRRGRPSLTARIEHVDDEVRVPDHLVA